MRGRPMDAAAFYVGTVYNWAAVLVPAYEPAGRFIDPNMSGSGEESGDAPC